MIPDQRSCTLSNCCSSLSYSSPAFSVVVIAIAIVVNFSTASCTNINTTFYGNSQPEQHQENSTDEMRTVLGTNTTITILAKPPENIIDDYGSSGEDQASPPVFEPAYIGNNNDKDKSKESIEEPTKSIRRKIFEICFLVENAFSILLNAFVMSALGLNRKLRRKSSIKSFMSLQLTHILMGVVSVAHSIDSTYALVFSLIANGLLLEAFFSMLLQAMDKFLAIRFPFKHQRMLERKVFEILILVSWLIASSIPFTLAFSFGHVDKNSVLYVLTATIAASFIFLTASNVLVLNTARRHVHAINKTMVGNNNNNDNENGGKIYKINRLFRLAKYSKSIMTSVIIIATFLVLWTPFLVQNVIAVRDKQMPSYDNSFTFAAVFVALLNGIADPIIMTVFNKDVKKLIRKSTSIRRRNLYLKDFKSDTSNRNKIQKNDVGNNSKTSSLSSSSTSNF